MSSSQETATYLMDQIADAGVIRSHKMFGEYALYCNEKVIGFVCDDQLYLKALTEAIAQLEEPIFGPPYPGAKDYLLIPEDLWSNKYLLVSLVSTIAQLLPTSTPKKTKAKRS